MKEVDVPVVRVETVDSVVWGGTIRPCSFEPAGDGVNAGSFALKLVAIKPVA